MIFEALLFCWLVLFSLQAWFVAKGLAELRGGRSAASGTATSATAAR